MGATSGGSTGGFDLENAPARQDFWQFVVK